MVYFEKLGFLRIFFYFIFTIHLVAIEARNMSTGSLKKREMCLQGRNRSAKCDYWVATEVRNVSTGSP